ncbi:hypothetical protein ABZW30_20820 [Kitasatospora sp. NPDC004669]|uniref:hypothetical protein n=1 Tax=Kitasatospora sp. NPDC004669 TaxID=3154555 RepID=UPI0033B13073
MDHPPRVHRPTALAVLGAALAVLTSAALAELAVQPLRRAHPGAANLLFLVIVGAGTVLLTHAACAAVRRRR